MVVVVVIVVHFERVEDGEEVEREICILTTRGPARQWERKKRLIMGPTQEDASFSRMTWRKYCSPFHDKGPISRQKIGLIDTTRSACSSPTDADAMERWRRHSAAALFRQIADVLITRLFTPRLCMTARLSRTDGRPTATAAALPLHWRNNNCGGAVRWRRMVRREPLKSGAQFTPPLWDTTYRKIRIG